MAGKMTDGTVNLWDMRQIRAYAEGARDIAANNPHTVGTPESDAFLAGAADLIAGTIDACVAGGTVQS